MSQAKGTTLVALSGMLYGALGYFGTILISRHFNISSMLFWRFLIAAIWIIICATAKKKNILQYSGKKLVFVQTMFFGVLTYTGSSFFYFLATTYIGTGIAMVIFFSYPIFVVLLAWLFSGWQINKHALISLLALIMGLFLLKGPSNDALNLMGMGFAALGGLSYALYIYGNKNSAKIIDSGLQALVICLGNAIIFLILALYNEGLSVPATLNEWCYAIGLGVIATALPIQLLLDGLRYISSIKASILSVLEPIVTLLIGLALLNESISFIQTLGIVTVLIGAIFIQFDKEQVGEIKSPVYPD